MEKKFDSPKRRDHQEKVHVTRFPASARVGPVWEICEASAQSPTITSYHVFVCRRHCSPFCIPPLYTSGIFRNAYCILQSNTSPCPLRSKGVSRLCADCGLEAGDAERRYGPALQVGWAAGAQQVCFERAGDLCARQLVLTATSAVVRKIALLPQY